MGYIHEYFSNEHYVSNHQQMNNEPDTGYCWLAAKYAAGILCKNLSSSSGYSSTFNFSDHCRLKALTAKEIGYHHVKTVCLRKDLISVEGRMGLTIILVPSYARFQIHVWNSRRFVPIDGRYISAIAIGDHISWSLKLMSGSLLEMNVIEY